MGRQGLYADAVVYDILYTCGTAGEMRAFMRLEMQFAQGRTLRGAHWFEPACGTGRYLRVAQKRGMRITGFDLDEGQLDYARGRLEVPPGALFQADMADFSASASKSGLEPDSVDFAFNPVNSIRHLDSDQAMLAHFEQMAEFMKPGAVYVVGLSLTDYENLMPEEDLWRTGRGHLKVSQLVNYLPPEPGTEKDRTEQVISHLTVEQPNRTEHFDDTYDLRTYDTKQWRDLIGKSRLDHVGSFDAFAKPRDGRVLAYQLEVLRKP